MKYSELERKLKRYKCYNTGKQANGHPVWHSPLTGNDFRLSNHREQEVASGTLRKIKKESGIFWI